MHWQDGVTFPEITHFVYDVLLAAALLIHLGGFRRGRHFTGNKNVPNSRGGVEFGLQFCALAGKVFFKCGRVWDLGFLFFFPLCNPRYSNSQLRLVPRSISSKRVLLELLCPLLPEFEPSSTCEPYSHCGVDRQAGEKRATMGSIPRPLFVATHPRACSTAFERVFMTQREALNTIHEPFGDCFYFGPERLSERYEADEQARVKSGFQNSTYKSVMDHIKKETTEVRESCSP